MRWFLRMQEFYFALENMPDKDNMVAGGLSCNVITAIRCRYTGVHNWFQQMWTGRRLTRCGLVSNQRGYVHSKAYLLECSSVDMTKCRERDRAIEILSRCARLRGDSDYPREHRARVLLADVYLISRKRRLSMPYLPVLRNHGGHVVSKATATNQSIIVS